jgi:phosphoserine phosphatase RsbU/P
MIGALGAPHLTKPHAFLAETDLLRGLPEDVLAGIRPQLRERFVQAGQALFRDGDNAAAVYLIADGALRIEKDGISLATRGVGECVGEFALMDAGVRSASAIALTDVALLEWSDADAWRALAISEELRHSVFRVLIGKLRQDVAAQVTAALEREQLQQDLRRAREIQEAMLPLDDLETQDMIISGISRPALDVGGDYFDAVATAPRTCSALIADVAGHGLHAALLVAMAKTCFQTQVHADSRTARIVEALNRSLLHSVRSGMLMTCVSVTIDAGAGVLSYTNAGHPPPLHLKCASGDVDALDATDPLLGIEMFRDASFNEARTSWQAGDRLLMYSDGVSEARNDAGEEFGRARIAQALRDSGDLPARSIRGRLADEILRFSGARPQDDDMTIVVVEGR